MSPLKSCRWWWWFHSLMVAWAGASLVAQLVKNLPAVQEIQLDSWVGKITWRRDRLPTILGLPWWAQTIKNPPVMRRPGLDPWVGKILWRKVWQPTPVFLPGESPWAEEPGGLQSMGSRRVTHEWVTKYSTARPGNIQEPQQVSKRTKQNL